MVVLERPSIPGKRNRKSFLENKSGFFCRKKQYDKDRFRQKKQVLRGGSLGSKLTLAIRN